ncbi:MAG: hypothetical protein J0I20_02390 [Chloroflexi bacterium]|nr:hypothetical protein [Chloroflexota bacterium]
MTKRIFSLIIIFMKNKPNSNILGLRGLRGGLLRGLLPTLALVSLLWLAAACTDQAATTPTPASTTVGILPGLTSPPPVGSPSADTALAPTATALALPTLVPATPTPVADTQAKSVLEKIQAATSKLSTDAKTFRYRLQQSGQLDSAGSVSAFEAAGSGEFQRPAFHQLLTLKVSGQEQAIELYGSQNQLFQRVTGLVAWRPLQPAVAGPYPGLVQSQGFTSAGSENLDSLKTSKYTWTFPASLLMPSSGQPEGLGALSITNLYLGFTGDKTSQAQATLWVDDATGNVARYQVAATFIGSGAKLTYSTTYDYAEFDSADVKVAVPGDLPK